VIAGIGTGCHEANLGLASARRESLPPIRLVLVYTCVLTCAL
jgi:hypothetical protein